MPSVILRELSQCFLIKSLNLIFSVMSLYTLSVYSWSSKCAENRDVVGVCAVPRWGEALWPSEGARPHSLSHSCFCHLADTLYMPLWCDTSSSVQHCASGSKVPSLCRKKQRLESVVGLGRDQCRDAGSK